MLNWILLMIGLLGMLVGALLLLTGFVVKRARQMLFGAGISNLVLFGTSFTVGYYNGCVNMNNLPTGTQVGVEQSPSGAYTLKFYLVEGGGVTVEKPSLRVEVDFNRTHASSKNIYWNYGEDSATTKWINDRTVSINGHVINVLHGKYDSRNNPWF